MSGGVRSQFGLSPDVQLDANLLRFSLQRRSNDHSRLFFKTNILLTGQMACRMLAEAGFGQVEMLDSPRPQNCIYACRA